MAARAAGPACSRLVALLVASGLAAALGQFPGDELHEIIDVWADIEELDVGDLDDELSDLPTDFAFEMKKRKHVPAVPKTSDLQDIDAFAEGNNKATQMSFVAFRQELCEQLGKRGTEDRAAMWKTMLETGGVKAQLHVTDPGKILFVTRRMEMLERIKEFALSQPETDWFEYRQQKIYPEGRSGPLLDHEERNKREVELGWREKPLPPRPNFAKVVDPNEPKKKKGKGKKKKA